MWGQDQEGKGGGPLAASWMRGPYTIEGDYIKPLPEGEMERYDPFASYYGADSARLERSLYLELIDLELGNHQAVERFVTTRGLLGLFQHRLVQLSTVIAFPIGSLRGDAVPEMLFEAFHSPGSVPAWTSSGAAWLTDDTPAGPEARKVLYDRWRQRRPFPEGWAISETVDGYYDVSSREDYYSHYFPDPLDEGVPPEVAAEALRRVAKDPTSDEAAQILELLSYDDPYPRAGSNAMWVRLCEPLGDFYLAALELRATYSACAERKDPTSVAAALMNCTRHLRRVHPIPHRTEEGGWAWRWSFPSLLAACYTMLFLDFVVEKRRLYFCAECGKSMISDRSDKKYCDSTCQNRANQRRWRQRSATASAKQKPKKGDTR
jgi:hypothetical protein